jgi:hypothetical protein
MLLDEGVERRGVDTHAPAHAEDREGAVGDQSPYSARGDLKGYSDVRDGQELPRA